jgi:pyruvate,orthophosphate dikinase
MELTEAVELSPETKQLLGWADEFRKLGVYANADTPRDAERARNFGATGVGLCRTEHMFMERDRLPIVQEMILSAAAAEGNNRELVKAKLELSEQVEGNRRHHDATAALAAIEAKMATPWKKYMDCLAQLLPIQRGDFKGILKAMEGHWVIIRLLDPPLHEFLPAHSDLLVDVTRLKALHGVSQEAYDKALAEIRTRREDANADLHSLETMLSRVESMKEFNPMLGLRVCRLGIVYPRSTKCRPAPSSKPLASWKKKALSQSRGDDSRCWKRQRDDVHPQTGGSRSHGRSTSRRPKSRAQIGTMIELPRACVVAGDLAKHADFFSFGTNDLTQTTLGYSRDDAAGTFVPVYLEEKILKNDPFQVIDTVGVGRLMKLAVEEGRATNPNLEVGICGEHGGEPESVAFCHTLGLNYVSCSPFRVPIARLAAAHAALADKATFKDR